jgi:hypothetical protein
MITQLVKIFTTFYWSWIFTMWFTKAGHWTLSSRLNPVNNLISDFPKIRFNTDIPKQNDPFTWVFSNKFQMLFSCPGRLIRHDLITLMTLHAEPDYEVPHHVIFSFLFLLPLCLSIYLSIYLSMALPPFVGLWLLFQFLDLFYTVGRTSWMEDKPVARPLPALRTAQTQNKRS